MKFLRNLEGLVALQPDFIGFIFYAKSPRYVIGELRPEDVKSIPASIKKVGVFVNEDRQRLLELVKEYDIDLVQLHGDEPPGYCAEVQKNIPVMKAFSMSDDVDFCAIDAYEKYIDYFLFDTKTPKYGGSGLQFNWEVLNKYSLDRPFFLSGGIGVADLDKIKKLDFPHLYAIDINSKVEVGPGLKDLPMIEEFKKGLEKEVGST